MKNLYLLLILLLVSPLQYGQPLNRSVYEIFQQSDLVFTGALSEKTSYLNEKGMICTQALFTDIRWFKEGEETGKIHAIHYLGGSLNGRSLRISNMPACAEGNRYLVFAYNNSRKYFNPLTAGNGYVFQIITDQATGKEYLTRNGGSAVTALENGKILLSEGILESVNDGHPLYRAKSPPRGSFMIPPRTSDRTDATAWPEKQTPAGTSLPLDCEQFMAEVQSGNIARNSTTLQPGYFYFENDGEITARKIETALFENLLCSGNYAASHPAQHPSDKPGVLGACGYHSLPYVLQNVPVGSWDYGMNGYIAGIWNSFMSIYQLAPNNGSFGWLNGENEFSGWLDSTLLFNAYGFYWTPFWPAVTFMDALDSGIFCSEIYETDIMFNAYLPWTNNWEIAYANPTATYYQNILNHELAYGWGMQYGIYEDTYNYDQPSVMHAFSNDIPEDGYGIHSEDAFWFRRNYDDQIPVNPIIDVGVEAYWANPLSGNMVNLEPALSDKPLYFAGDSITLFNVTVENNSDTAVYDMRLRFYLSADRHISTLDYQLGGPERYWFWNWFDAESWQTSPYGYQTYIPAYVPEGRYYIGAILTINGFHYDDFSRNNTVCFADSIYVMEPLGANTLSLSEKIHLMPNPAQELLTVSFGGAGEGSGMAEIYSLSGRKLLAQTVSGRRFTMDVSGLASGMYIFRLVNDKGTGVVKFIKQ